VLADYGYMREQGEGIPRMFEVMEREGLYPPEFRLDAGIIFTVTLRNTPVYDAETMRWLAQLGSLSLSGNQKRLLAYARKHGGTFTSRAYQQLVGIGVYEASQDIKDLIRKGLARLKRKGGRVYEVLPLPSAGATPKPEEYAALEHVLRKKGYVKNADIREQLKITRRQALHVARHLVDLGWLTPVGERRGRRYVPAK